MDTLDRFLLREFIVYFVLVVLGLAMVFLGVDFLSNFWKLNLPTSSAIMIYVYKLPAVLQQFFPVAALLATLLVLSGMSRQNEVLALYASGVSKLRLASTFIAAVATLSTLSFLTFDSLVPTLTRRQILVQQGLDPSQENLQSFSREGFWYRSGRLIYHVGQFRPETNTLENVDVYVMTSSYYLIEQIHAREAKFDGTDWVLSEGKVVTYPRDTHFPIAKEFKTKRGIIPDKPGDFKTLKFREDTMRLKDLRRFIARNASYGLDTTSQQVHYHERVALVFTPLVFVLLGIPFGLKPLKSQSTPRSIAFCFLIVFVYLLLFRMSLSVGKGGHIPPFMAAWAPNLLFLTFAGMRIMKN